MAWSSGKDSAYALHQVRESADFDVVAILTTLTSAYDRVVMHGVRRELLEAQAAALGLPLIAVEIPTPCSNQDYERIMSEAMAPIVERGIRHMIFGDLYLEDVRSYRERHLGPLGITCVTPLWGRDTRELAAEMMDAGIYATITSVDPRVLDASFAGRRWDPSEFPETVDPCGENGEMHTFVSAGPMFRAPIPIVAGEVVHRDGFYFADLELGTDEGGVPTEPAGGA